MNSRDRVYSVLNMEEPDLVPFFGSPHPAIFDKSFSPHMISKARQSTKSESYARYLKAQTDLIKKFDLSFMHMGILVDPTYNLQLENDRYVDETGRIKSTHLIGGISEAYMGGFLPTPSKYREFMRQRPPPVTDWRIDRVREAKKLAEELDLFLLIGTGSVVEIVMEACGIPNFLRYLYTDPQFLDEIIRDSALRTVVRVKMACEEGADGILIYDDYAYHSGPFFSVQHFMKHIQPWVKHVVSEIHKRGVPAFQHACGDIRSLMPGIIDAGYDAIEPLESTAGITISEMKERWGDKISLIGNVSLNTLVQGTPAATAMETENCIKAGARGGGYMLGASHAIHNQCRIDNVLAMLATWKQTGTYPIK
jgi:uroporphyrinogen-III decarboxylase